PHAGPPLHRTRRCRMPCWPPSSICRPPRPGLVRRPRLTARLSAGLRGPLTLLVAPAGFGKTTLLADWRAAQQQGAWPLAWLALDAGDNDLARFLRYVIAALQTLRADLGLALRARRLPRRRRPAHPPGNGLPARPPPAT